MTQHAILWSVTIPEPKSFLNKPLPQKTDVLVIGGGFTGTSAALQLAKGGARVTLLEAQTIGWGASSRNGGQALSCLHHTLADAIKEHGQERAKEMFLAATRAADVVEQIVMDEKIDCDYVRCGNIEAAFKPSHFDKLQREQKILHDVADYEVKILPKSETLSELGTDSYHGLMVNPRSGSVQPAKFVMGMALAAERAGADIHEGTQVMGIERAGNSPTNDGTRFMVKTERGDIETKEIMLATNAWIGNVVPQFRQRVFPAESFVIATEPLPRELAQQLIPNNRVVYDTRKTLAYYRLSPDNRMVWGGELTFAGVGAKTNINTLRNGMLRIFPELAKFNIDYFWHGTLGITLDENTHAGQIDGMWYSMCYVGHGVTLATYLGQQMANGILGKASNNPFANLSIPFAPTYQDKAWFVNIGKVWFRFLDMLR
ncbi:MAG: FAD-binding oxidoreductase [Anaerolineales bacterium]|nr:FAD-binding oxidoreductase [Anaerolineales bacterium]